MQYRLIALLFIFVGCTFEVPLTPPAPLPFDGDVATEDSHRSSLDAELGDSMSGRLDDLGPLTDAQIDGLDSDCGLSCVEVCNGLDDDGDGQTDEGVENACGGCDAVPLEVCDESDNDCDGNVDEGVLNACGGCGDVPEDVCDGVDNDCDGIIDQDCPCTVGAERACGIDMGACIPGQQICDAGQWGECIGRVGPVDEACDGIDNDCDGVVDEALVMMCGSSVGLCRLGESRCVDGDFQGCDGQIVPTSELCNAQDDDCDGRLDEDVASELTQCGIGECVNEGSITCESGALMNSCRPRPPAVERCDGLDNDCDRATDEEYAPEMTACGVGACRRTGTTRCVNGNVDDTCTPGAPSAGDGSCNGVDDDCDGRVDEGVSGTPITCGVGACRRDGMRSCVAGALQENCEPGQPRQDNNCDGLDDDCDGRVDEHFTVTQTQCGLGACTALGQILCVNGAQSSSCQPSAPAANDQTCNNIDDDCDGRTDENFNSQVTACGVGACAQNGATSCSNGQVSDSCQSGAPAAADISCDGRDDDCDGRVDENFVSEAITCGVGACVANGNTACNGGALIQDCRAADPAPNDATCDGIDDDCDGTPDENFSQSQTNCGLGICRAFGVNRCVNGSVEDSCVPEPNAVQEGGAFILRCDGFDNDCDGRTDEGYPDFRSCEPGELYCDRASAGIEVCDGDFDPR